MAAPAAAPVVNIYPRENYSFDEKAHRRVNYINTIGRLERIRMKYEEEGMRRTVQGILVVWEHNHPYILILKSIPTNFRELPGGRIRGDETEIDGLRRKLSNRLDPPGHPIDWQIGDQCVAKWCRPNYKNSVYPYCPAHITRPKEWLSIYLVHLSEREVFHVPGNLTMIAVPLFELYDNPEYGAVLSNLPNQLSRFQFNMIPANP